MKTKQVKKTVKSKKTTLATLYTKAASNLAKEMKDDDQAVRSCIMALDGLYDNLKGHKFEFEGIKINKVMFKALIEESLRHV